MAHPEDAALARFLALAALVFAGGVGAWFIARGRTALAVPGLLGLLLVVAYTPWLTRSALACLLAPGLGFGVLFVNLGFYALTGQFAAAAGWASLPVALLTSNLLLVNQIPDIEADRAVGRRHLAARLGARGARRISAWLLAAAALALLAGIGLGALPPGTLFALLALPLGATGLGLLARAERAAAGAGRAALLAGLGAAAAALLGPILLALGILGST
ncbi:MAG: hypothetical protein KatS3mg124_1899 [Porticoccaceae bacterium]|nr:MAG: hypothetical protein KatS3mg124_1899 [Porticoccaceae bacterium]